MAPAQRGTRTDATLPVGGAELLAFLEAMPESALLVDRAAHVLLANETAARRLGRSVEALIGSELFSHFPPEIAARRRLHFRNVVDNGIHVELTDERAGRWYRTRLLPVPDALGIVDRVVVLAFDVTEAHRRDDTHLRNQQRLDALLRLSESTDKTRQELLDAALDEAVALTRSDVGYIYFYSEATRLFTLYAWSHSVMQQCSIAEKQRVYSLDKTGIWGEAVRQRRAIVVNDFPAANPLKRGYPTGHVALRRFLTVPLMRDGEIVAVVGVGNKQSDYDEDDVRQLRLFMDSLWTVVERRVAGEKLQASERMYHGLVEASQDLVWRTDRNGVLTFVNGAWKQTHGWEPAELIGGTSARFQAAEVFERDVAAFVAQLQQQGSVRAFETTHLTRDGRTLHVLVTGVPLHDEAGALTGVQGTVFDITARKEAEEKLERLVAQTQEDAAEKSRLLAEVNHRVKNNLLSILGLLLAEQRLVPEAERASVAASVERTSARVRSLLAAHQRLSETAWAPLPIPELARRVIQPVLAAAPEPAAFALQIAPTALTVSPRQAGSLALVLNELATNVVKHGRREGGATTLRLESAAEEGFLRLTLRDDGPGFPSGWSAGVGLQLVRELVEGSLRGRLLVREPAAEIELKLRIEEVTRS